MRHSAFTYLYCIATFFEVNDLTTSSTTQLNSTLLPSGPFSLSSLYYYYRILLYRCKMNTFLFFIWKNLIYLICLSHIDQSRLVE